MGDAFKSTSHGHTRPEMSDDGLLSCSRDRRSLPTPSKTCDGQRVRVQAGPGLIDAGRSAVPASASSEIKAAEACRAIPILRDGRVRFRQ